MSIINFPYMGFSLSWCFYSESDNSYENYLQDKQVNENILNDLFNILTTCSKYELFFATHITKDDGIEAAFKSENTNDIINEIRAMLLSGEITYEIEKIRGYGYVAISEEEKIKCEDLVYLDSIRLFERTISLSTSKSIWVPISIDKTYEFKWQIELAERNGPRLTNCLQEIYEKLNISVSPQINELTNDFPVWQFGFKLYLNPEILKRELHSQTLTEEPGLDKFLYIP